jgi:hypothetical protein
MPVRVKKTRQNEKLESRSDSIGTEKALVPGTSARGSRSVRMWKKSADQPVKKSALVLSCVLAATLSAAGAQQPPTSVTPPQQTAPPAPAQSANCAPMAPSGSTMPDSPAGSTVGRAANEPLGDKLAKSDGVMCPPSGVDPEIRAPTPDAGTTPVIPPPGSPGGDPSVRPK